MSCTRVWMAQTIFGRQRKLERWWSPRPSTHSCYRWQYWKSAKCDSKRPNVGVRAVAAEVTFDRESVRRILREELNMRKFCAKMVPKLLSDERKERRICIALRMSQILLNSIVTCGETLVFTYDPLTKRQWMQWNSSSQKKKPLVVGSSRPCWLFSLICRVLWWQSGYPAARR